MKMTLKLVPPRSSDRNLPFSDPFGSSWDFNANYSQQRKATESAKPVQRWGNIWQTHLLSLASRTWSPPWERKLNDLSPKMSFVTSSAARQHGCGRCWAWDPAQNLRSDDVSSSTGLACMSLKPLASNPGGKINELTPFPAVSVFASVTSLNLLLGDIFHSLFLFLTKNVVSMQVSDWIVGSMLILLFRCWINYCMLFIL